MADSSNLSAVVVDGKVQQSTASQNSLSSKATKSSSSLDKDAFLQLLVAQMKYQDPLEPTDNTEYISQLATFSELEEMQNLSATASLSRASSLVGKEVVVKTVNTSTGGTTINQGYVDYVVYENNKAYVSIDEALYSVDDVYEVIDSNYSEAYTLAKQFVSALSSFPGVNNLTTDYEEALTTLRTTYDEMSSYQKSFVASDVLKLLEAYEEKMKELKVAAANKADNSSNSSEMSDEGEEGANEAEGVAEA